MCKSNYLGQKKKRHSMVVAIFLFVAQFFINPAEICAQKAVAKAPRW